MVTPMPLALSWCILAAQAEGVPAEWWEMRALLRREVGTYNPTSRHTTQRNPRSTAYGLGQFLDSTWRGTGIAKTSDPIMQLRAVYRYCHRRYGSVAGAVRFHRRRGYY
jgi:hypothetical protein